jgi:hypothetical protein
VDSDSKELHVGGEEPESLELRLQTPDADGDGYVAMLEGGGGTDCDDTRAATYPGNPEVCDSLDNNCDPDRAVDEGFDKEWYRDADKDGTVVQGSRAFGCTPPDASYVRWRYQPFDCDDNDPERNPFHFEICDGKDNNCGGGVDEFFSDKGTPCTNDVCTGTRVCNAAKTATVCSAPAPVTYYVDADGDGQGAVGTAGTKVCAPSAAPAGAASNSSDCDDADRMTLAGLPEVCDAVDNNCNGQVDEDLSCGGTLSRVSPSTLGGTDRDWRAVAVGPGKLPVWIAGLGGKLVVRRTAGGAFQSHSFGDTPANTTNCGDFDWYAAWVRPSDGHVFLAGEGGRVAHHTGSACIDQADLAGTGHATGIIGFESGGVTTLYLVSAEGRLFTWAPGSAPVERGNSSNVYNGIHALNPNLLLVAGGSNVGTQSIYGYANGSLGTEILHTTSNLINGDMNAVWMGASNLAYAVGDSGYVWRWNGGTGWELLSRPPGVTSNLYGVVTLPNGDAYMVDSGANGQLHRRTQYGWARGPKLPTAAVPLFGIAMSSERDFWVVGDDGFVFHYPER